LFVIARSTVGSGAWQCPKNRKEPDGDKHLSDVTNIMMEGHSSSEEEARVSAGKVYEAVLSTMKVWRSQISPSANAMADKKGGER
jgi:hypothetical protein